MVNILLEDFDLSAPYLYDELKKHITCGMKVAVIAFSFRDSRVKSISDWNKLYSKDFGMYYSEIVRGLRAYGISEDDITFLNYFADTRQTAKDKIKNADIIYFLGGLPDKMYERILEFGIYEALNDFDGIVMGYSAGAVIQLAEYHLSPDTDYPDFGYYKGIPYLNGFYLEVHYEDNPVQNEAIKRVIAERRTTVYATDANKGAVVVDNGNIKLLGNVKIFS